MFEERERRGEGAFEGAFTSCTQKEKRKKKKT